VTRGDDGGVVAAMAVDGVAFPYTFRRTLALAPDTATLRLEYAVQNNGGDPFSYIWSAHPLLRLERGMRVELPEGTLMHLNSVGRGGDDAPVPGVYPWPLRAGSLDLTELPAPDAGVSCKLWSRPLAEGRVRLSAPGGTLSLAFDPALLPQVGLWVNAGGWSGTGSAPYSNLGLEPCIGAQDSLADAVERYNLYRTLAPGETHRWWLEVAMG
jgi:galactose mutarotase-like enzyme